MKIAVLIPCYNEENTVAQVVRNFRAQLPEAEIHVYDNASDDGTAQKALVAGAIVTTEPRRGKGSVIRSMFRDINADIYVMVDGDQTYPAAAVHQLIEPILTKQADMVVGDRLTGAGYEQTQQRRFHRFGNQLVLRLVNRLFNARMCDIMSGYRAFNRVFVKTMPVLSKGFEVETEMTLHALDKDFKIREVKIDYRERPPGSVSKLNTIGDGIKVLKTLFLIFKDFKPFIFFSYLSLLFTLVGFAAGLPPILDYIQYRYVLHVPLAILAVGFMILAMLFFSVGLILDTVTKFHRLEFELHLNRYVESQEIHSSVREGRWPTSNG
jgi:glycosyltransferase involved in cell wall biosynthesis